jgi:hypothetical protein
MGLKRHIVQCAKRCSNNLFNWHLSNAQQNGSQCCSGHYRSIQLRVRLRLADFSAAAQATQRAHFRMLLT